MSLAWDAPKRIVRLEFSRFTSSKATATKGWLLSPPFNIFVPCSIIDLAPQVRRARPSTLPAPLRANLFDNLATGSPAGAGHAISAALCERSRRGEPVPAMWNRYRDHPQVLQRAR
jgi:hypothetical protein